MPTHDVCPQCRGEGVWMLTVIDCVDGTCTTKVLDCWCQD